MAIPLEQLEAKLTEARRLYPDVERSMRLRGAILQHALQKNPQAPTGGDYMYRHKRTQWRCRVRVTPTGLTTHVLMWWWHGPEAYRNEALDAILLRGHNFPLHFDSHFWGRWGLRTEVMGVKLTNLMGFFKQYPDLPMRQGKRFYPAQPEFAAAIDQGLVFGRLNGKRIISCDTFKGLDMFSPEERQLWEKLRKKDAHRIDHTR